MVTAQRKSRGISLGITAALAASLLTGCASDDPEYDGVCADTSTYERLSDDYCDDDSSDGHSGGRWYYISSGGRYPALGSKVSGGSFSRPSNAAAIRTGGQSSMGGTVKGTTSRGGFGGKSGGSGS